MWISWVLFLQSPLISETLLCYLNHLDLSKVQILSLWLSKTTILLMVTTFLPYGSECASRQKTGETIGPTSFIFYHNPCLKSESSCSIYFVQFLVIYSRRCSLLLQRNWKQKTVIFSYCGQVEILSLSHKVVRITIRTKREIANEDYYFNSQWKSFLLPVHS